jgi:oligopeptide/dipeptide ABC transporter ATP-binding protein
MSTTRDEQAPGDLLEVEDLRKEYTSRKGALRRGTGVSVRAVDGVSFRVGRGETFGLVGESGCGKSTIARCILRLVEPDDGRVVFDGVDVRALSREGLRRLRRRMQIVFQDPFASLNPRMQVRSIVEEPLVIHGLGDRRERDERVREILELVGLTAEQSRRKPHEFSGGQRQRIALARALVVNPELVILDEPVSALDVSIQAQVLNLLRELQQELQLTYVFIVHDLAVAEYFCDRLAVLYLGAVMELTDRQRLFRAPLHPYTEALLAAVPIPDPAAERRRRHIVLRGEVSAEAGSVGCRFKVRCPVGRERVACDEAPPLIEHEAGHLAACHFPAELRTGETSAVGPAADGPS